MSNTEDMRSRLRELEKIAVDPNTDHTVRDRATTERLGLMLKLQRGV